LSPRLTIKHERMLVEAEPWAEDSRHTRR